MTPETPRENPRDWRPNRNAGRRGLAAALLHVALAASPAWAPPADTPPPAATPAPRAPYLLRGDEVERSYQAYRRRLGGLFDALGVRLDAKAPELRAKLAPPAPVPHGYRILPRFVPDPPPPARRTRIITASFSWPRTESLIARERGRLDALEARLADTARRAEGDRAREYRELVDEYAKLAAGQRLIESTIQYNRLWQAEIVKYPRLYAEMTDLHDAVVERQALLDAMPLGEDRAAAILFARARTLTARIEAAMRKWPAPAFLRVEQPAPHRWVLTVPLYTDIEDDAFLAQAGAAIEQAWQVSDGEDAFRVALEVRRVALDTLYPDGSVPARGADVDIVDHTRRFPPDGAVLTTGANTTHIRGRYIVLGPHDLAPNVLAHEFGHVLGFKDGYFRGYGDLGADGYEVLEVSLPPDQVLSAPQQGEVRRAHFEEILSETAPR